MGKVSRRAAMLAVPTVAGGLAMAGGAGVAEAAGLATTLEFTARRSKFTLPDPLPANPIGLTFTGLLDLYDKANTKIGDGSLTSMVVDVIVGVPLQLVVHSNVIFRITGGLAVGEIHTSNMHIRVVPQPGVTHVLAIVGGTGAYRTAQGDGTIEHVTLTDTKVVLNLNA